MTGDVRPFLRAELGARWHLGRPREPAGTLLLKQKGSEDGGSLFMGYHA